MVLLLADLTFVSLPLGCSGWSLWLAPHLAALSRLVRFAFVATAEVSTVARLSIVSYISPPPTPPPHPLANNQHSIKF